MPWARMQAAYLSWTALLIVGFCLAITPWRVLHARCAFRKAGDRLSVEPAAGRWSPVDGSGKLGTPCVRMQAENWSAAPRTAATLAERVVVSGLLDEPQAAITKAHAINATASSRGA